MDDFGERARMNLTWGRLHFRLGRTATVTMLLAVLAARAPAQPDAGSGAKAKEAQSSEIAAPKGPNVGPEPLARFAPASARFYVHTDRLANTETLIQQTHSVEFLKRLAETFEWDAKLFDLRSRMAAFLNLTASVDQARLSRLEAAMISSSAVDAASTVWLARLSRTDMLADWFEPKRRTAETKSGDVVSFATDDGFTVCVRQDVVAMGRRQRGRSILREVYNNLTTEGAAGRSLADSPLYRDLAAELPGGEACSAFLSTGGAKSGNLAPWSPMVVERVLLGAYNEEGSLFVAARGIHGEKNTPSALHRTAVETFARLPATTFGAAAVRVDVTSLKSRFAAILDLLAIFPVPETDDGTTGDVSSWQSRLEDFGPELIVIWGQPIALADQRPQVGLMIRCRDARAVRTDFSRMLAHAIRWLGTMDEVDADALPKFKLTTHLGTPIVYVFPGDYPDQSRLGWTSTLKGMTPAWAAWGDWFMVTASLEHMQRILDAQTGMAPTLATLPEIARHLSTAHEPAGVFMLQPQLAAAALENWSKDFETLPDEHWVNEWWDEVVEFLEGSADHVWLDIFKFVGQRGSGTVNVAQVDAAPGIAVPLQSGDLVIGVNDMLLSLNDPLGTLEELWDAEPRAHILRVRVIRSGKAIEVDVVPGSLTRGGMATLLDSPARVARTAAELMQGVNFAGWTWRFGADQRFAADLVVTCAKVE